MPEPVPPKPPRTEIEGETLAPPPSVGSAAVDEGSAGRIATGVRENDTTVKRIRDGVWVNDIPTVVIIVGAVADRRLVMAAAVQQE
jgi:hypothetical protein